MAFQSFQEILKLCEKEGWEFWELWPETIRMNAVCRQRKLLRK